MSHIALVRVKIRNPNMTLLKQAVEALANEIGGSLTNTIRDFYGNEVSVELGVRNDVFKRGVGVVVEDGEVKLKGDFWGINQKEIVKLQNALMRNYVALGLTGALRHLGYNVVAQRGENYIHIRAVA